LQLLQGGRDLLLAAACSAHEPRAYYPRQSFREALDFLQGCRVGQTERGSFVATILAPVPPSLDRAAPQSLYPEMAEGLRIAAEPYPRRVTLRLMASLGLVHEALRAGSPERMLQEVPAGVSANLCEALTAMSPSSPQGSLEVDMSWARTRGDV